MPYAAGRRRSFAFRADPRLRLQTASPTPSRSRLFWCSVAGIRHTVCGIRLQI
ncbi:MAG: hypothetical protein ACR2L2_02645 [Acidobacteriota bacterium]